MQNPIQTVTQARDQTPWSAEAATLPTAPSNLKRVL